MHLPSEILFENSPADVLRGNILEWDQALDARLQQRAAGPFACRWHRMSILYTTLLLFGSTIVAAAAAFAARTLVGGPPWPPWRTGGVGPLMRPDAPQKAVLRCGRCGRVSAWPDARLQVECGCRAHVDLAPPLGA
jgi:hypothetical protein